MASSPKSPHPTHPPLNRWKARFRILNKPTLWVSTSILLLTGLLIADYSRVQAGNLQSEAPADTADEIDEAKILDQQPATLDGIPLPEDPAQREWAIREANNLNSTTDEQETSLSPQNDESAAPIEFREKDSIPSIPSSEGHLLARNLAKEKQESNESDTPTRQRRNQQGTPPESVFSDYMDRTDDVLSLMGLKTQAPQINSRTTSPNETPDSASANLFSISTSSTETLPTSALSQALQGLATPPDPSAPDSSSGPALSPLLNNTAVQRPPEGLPILQAPIIQTAPPPGTTGYVTPPPLPTTALSAPGNAPIVPPTAPINSGLSIGMPGTTTSGTALPIQPNVTLPQNPGSTAAPTPVLAPPASIDHTPYTGGGRNGRINTFSNP